MEIRQNKHESDVCYDKRKAYIQQYVATRIGVNNCALLDKQKYAVPIDEKIKEDVLDFWSGILNSHTDMLAMGFFDVYNAVEEDKSKLKYYIPDSFYYAWIDEWLTHPARSSKVDDKQLYPYLFAGYKTTEVIARKVGDNFFDEDFKPISIAKFSEICKSQDEVVVKASISSYGGHAVRFFNMKEDTIEQVIAYMSKPPYFYTQPYGTEYVVEKPIKQHKDMAAFNASSVNTIRVITMIWDGKCIPLSSVLRMGIDGSRVDNCSSGGIVAGIKDDGTLKDVAYTAKGKKFTEHPNTGKFCGKVIPNFAKAIDMVKELHWRFSGISQLISWDIAIDENGEPVVIEMNISYGEIDFHQYCNGPIFGDMTKEVLTKFKYKSYTYNAFIGNIGIY